MVTDDPSEAGSKGDRPTSPTGGPLRPGGGAADASGTADATPASADVTEQPWVRKAEPGLTRVAGAGRGAVGRYPDIVEPSRPAPLWLRVAVVLGILASVAVTFEPALEAGFVNWDDDHVVVGNANFGGFTDAHLHWMFTSVEFGHYQPLTWLSYAVDEALLQSVVQTNDEFVFHLTSVVLHAISGVLCYLVARRVLAAAAGRAWEYRRTAFVLGGAVAALLFALHPLRAESVAWVTERRDVLAMVFYLGCVLAYVRYTRGGRWWYLVALLCLALSLLSKAAAMTLPVALLIVDVYPLRRLRRRVGSAGDAAADPLPPPKPGTLPAWRLVVEKLPMLALAGGAAVMAYHAQRATGAAYTLAEYDVTARAAQAVYGLAFYVWKTVLPTGLGPMIQLPPRAVLVGDMFTISAIAVGGGLLIALLLVRRQPWWLAAAAVYAVTVSPVLGLAQSGPQLVADRYSYFSCLPWAMLGGGLIATLVARVPQSLSARRGANVACAAAAVLIALLSRATWQQCDVWAWPLSLWRQAVKTCPESSIAHAKYADTIAMMAAGSPDERSMYAAAAQHYRRSLQLNPADPLTWLHMARLLHLTRAYDEAIVCYERVAALDPMRRGLHDEYANFLIRIRDWPRALAVFREGVRMHPKDLSLSLQLAELLATVPVDDLRDGAAALQIAEELDALTDGGDFTVLETLAAARATVGDFDQAAEIADRAADLAARYGDTRSYTRLTEKARMFREGTPFRLSP